MPPSTTILNAAIAIVLSTAQPAGLPIGDDPGAMATGTARMVDAMLEYARWPGNPDQVRLCLLGPVRHAGRLGSISLSQGRTISIRRASAASDIPASCDVVYFAATTVPEMKQITASARERAVLTIAENDPSCRSEAMFCLAPSPGSLSFRLNIDAVSRSSVRVDPRVLRVAKGG